MKWWNDRPKNWINRLGEILALSLILSFVVFACGTSPTDFRRTPSDRYILEEPMKSLTPMGLEKDHVAPRYGFTEDDVYLLAQLLCGDKGTDGDGEYDFVYRVLNGKDVGYDQISLVLCVVMNRVRSGSYPDNVSNVVLQPDQFIVFPANLKATPHKVAIEKIRDWCAAYNQWDSSIQLIPEDHLYFTGDGVVNVSYNDWRSK